MNWVAIFVFDSVFRWGYFNTFCTAKSDSLLGNHAVFYLDNEKQDLDDLKESLASEYQNTHFLNADCIWATIIRLDEFDSDQKGLQQLVEKLLREAQERAIESAFGKHPVIRDMLFQKLRKLLFELLLNVFEHSHTKGKPAFAGIYARVRGAKPLDEVAAKTWVELFNRHAYGQSQFAPNHYSEWLELFICDVGKGLLSDIQNWKDPKDNKQIATILKKAKTSKNPLESIGVHLFHHALSSHYRDDKEKTAVTGLQHLGHLLAIGNDYCSIYTQEGSWIGGHFPWAKAAYSRKDIQDDTEFAKYKPVSGTAYTFCIQPNHRRLSSYKEKWTEPDINACEAIRTALKTQRTADMKGVIFYERRTTTHCSPPTYEEISLVAPDVVVVRPPRLMSKQDFARWFSLIAEDPKFGNVWPAKIFVLADLTPFQVLTFRELMLEGRVFQQASLEVYLVSEHWAVTCFNVSDELGKFVESIDKAKLFLNPITSDSLFSAAQLAVLLREKDSEIFWQSDTDDHEQPFLSFFNKPVQWHDSHNKENTILLERYLDFPHALADPKRYRACRRALRRCLALFPNHQVLGADKLISSLVNDAKLGAYTEKEDINPELPVVIVGSIAVNPINLSQNP